MNGNLFRCQTHKKIFSFLCESQRQVDNVFLKPAKCKPYFLQKVEKDANRISSGHSKLMARQWDFQKLETYEKGISTIEHT